MSRGRERLCIFFGYAADKSRECNPLFTVAEGPGDLLSNHIGSEDLPIHALNKTDVDLAEINF
jgi:hypothetical protein